MSTPTLPPHLLAELQANHDQTKASLCQTMDDYFQRTLVLLGGALPPGGSSVLEAEEVAVAAEVAATPLNLVCKPGGNSEEATTGPQGTAASIQSPPPLVAVPNETIKVATIKEEIIAEEEEVAPPPPPASLDLPPYSEEDPPTPAVPNETATPAASPNENLPIKQEMMMSPVQGAEPTDTPLPSASPVNEGEAGVSNGASVASGESPEQTAPAESSATIFQLAIHPNSAFSRPPTEPVPAEPEASSNSRSTPKSTRNLSESEAESDQPVPSKRLRTHSASQETADPGPSGRLLPVDSTDNRPKAPTRSSSSSPKESPENPGKVNNNSPYFVIKHISCLLEDCPERFESVEAQHRHINTVHGLAPFECPLDGCTRRYDTNAEVLTHYAYDHAGRAHWQCRSCSRVCTTSHQLDRHHFLDHEPGEYLCPQACCPFETTTRGAAIAHFREVHLKQKKPKNQPEVRTFPKGQKYTTLQWKCPHCPDSWFFSGRALEQHLSGKHRQRAYPCTVDRCKVSFASKSALLHHYQVVHGPHLHAWHCSQCPRILDSIFSYVRHQFHGHAHGLFRCTECSFEALTRTNVLHHFNRKHDQFNYQWPRYEKITSLLFSTRDTLRRYTITPSKCFHCTEWFIDSHHDQTIHEIIEHGNLWEQCHASGCRRLFEHLTDLEKHIATEHQPEDQTRWICPQCSRSFSSTHDLGVHQYDDHDEGCYNCTQCNYKTKVLGQMLDHRIEEHGDERTSGEAPKELRVHDDNKKYRTIGRLECPKCPYNCQNMYNMEDHLSEVHRIGLFSCSASGCDRSYTNRIEFLIHQENGHKEIDSWRCDQCEANFPTGHRLNRHQVMVHDEEFGQVMARIEDDEVDLFECVSCKRPFKFRIDVIQHWNEEHGDYDD